MISHLCCSARGDLCDFAAHCALCLENLASTEDDEEERGLLLAVRNPEASVASPTSIQVSFETGPALREFDYSIKCVLFEDARLDGCDANAVGDVATGQTTTDKSTIVDEVTGLQSEIDYQCYIIIENEKHSKCNYVVTPTIDAPPAGPVINLAGVNSQATPVQAFYLRNISSSPPDWHEITGDTGDYQPATWASLSGDVMAVTFNGVNEDADGLWYTENITAFIEGTDSFDNGFTRLPATANTLSATIASNSFGIQIGYGNRMVAWDGTDLYGAEDWTSNSFSFTVGGSGVTYASVTGDLVAAASQSNNEYTIYLFTNLFTTGSSENIPLDISGLKPDPSCECSLLVSSVSLYGDYLAFTTFWDGDVPANDASKIYYVDLSAMQAPYTSVNFVEVPTPTNWAAQTSGVGAVPLEVSIALGHMVVTYQTSVSVNNIALTTDFIGVGPDGWEFPPGQITHQQLSSPDDVPVPPVFS